jgi:protein-tyrosine phosphatase
MDRIPPDRLWIGHAGDSRNHPQLLENGIEAIVQVAIEERAIQAPPELIALRFPMTDAGGSQAELMHLAIITVANLIQARIPTLVCCAAGMSRSPAIAAAALSVAHREPPESSLRRVARYRRTDVSPQLWSEILQIISSWPPGCDSSGYQNPFDG